MNNINKQQTGFKFGQHRLTVLKEYGKVEYKDRTYKLVSVQTYDGLIYQSLRLYNGKGKFIKQMLFEPEISEQLAGIIWPHLPSHITEALNSGDGVYRP